MRIIDEMKLDYKDVLITPKRSNLSSRSEVDLQRSYTFLNSGNTWTGVPLMVANMDTTGTFEVAEATNDQGIITCIDKHYSVEEWKRFGSQHPDKLANMAVSVGRSNEEFEKLEQVMEALEVGFINLDVANGYSEKFNKHVKRVRKRFPNKNIIAGNVVTGEMVEELLLSGADIVKVGVGSGSVCTTRVKTGVGYPQLSAVIECADAAHGLKGMIIADGGCNVAGDVCKAFGAGADFVMLGGMFAGHKESAGELIEKDGKQFKVFYGMASKRAMETHQGGLKDYRASEGKVVLVPYRGPISNTVKDILGGLRSACTYVGAKQLRELSKRTTFVRVTQQENTVYSNTNNLIEK